MMSSSSSSSSSSGSGSEVEVEGGGKASASSSSRSASSNPNSEVEDNEKEEDFDMYADLETSVFQRSTDPGHKTREELESRLKEVENMLADSLKDRADLRTKVTELSKENKILLRNASSLLRTAKDEIARKNVMLTNFQKRLTSMARKVKATRSTSPATKAEFEDILQLCQKCSEVSSGAIAGADIQQLVEAEKRKLAETGLKLASGIWSKKLRLNNMSIYFKSDQVPFSRLETVTFPTLQIQKPKIDSVPVTANMPLRIPDSGTKEPVAASVFQSESSAVKSSKSSTEEGSSAGGTSSERNSDKQDLRTDLAVPIVDSRNRGSRVVQDTNGQGSTQRSQTRADRERELFGTPSPRRPRSPKVDSRHLNKSRSPQRNSGASLHPNRSNSPPRHSISWSNRPRSPNTNQHHVSERQHYDRRRHRESGELSRTPSPSNYLRPKSSGQDRDRYDHYHDKYKRRRYYK